MPIVKIGPQEIDKFNELNLYAESIKRLYDQLYKLEFEGKKESLEYKKLIVNLKVELAREKKAYQSPILTTIMCEAFSTLIIENTPNDFPNNIEYVVRGYDIKSPQRRILTKLDEHVNSNPDNIKQRFQERLKEMFQEISSGDFDKIFNSSFTISNCLNSALKKDFFNLMLSNIELEVNNPCFRRLKDKLIKLKYSLAFISADIEDDMISSNFTVPQESFVSSKIVADINRIPDFQFTFMKDHMCNLIATPIIKLLLSIDDSGFVDDDKNLEALFIQSLLRSVLFMASDREVEFLKELVETSISGSSSKREIPNNISCSILRQAFDYRLKDKSTHKVLSLKQNFQF